MSKDIRYSTGFKQEAVNQVKIHGYSTAEVADRQGVTTKAIYRCIKELSKLVGIRAEESDLRAEVARLKRELKRTEQERNTLKEVSVL